MTEESLLEWFLRNPIKQLVEEVFGERKGSGIKSRGRCGVKRAYAVRVPGPRKHETPEGRR